MLSLTCEAIRAEPAPCGADDHSRGHRTDGAGPVSARP